MLWVTHLNLVRRGDVAAVAGSAAPSLPCPTCLTERFAGADNGSCPPILSDKDVHVDIIPL